MPQAVPRVGRWDDLDELIAAARRQHETDVAKYEMLLMQGESKTSRLRGNRFAALART